MKILKIESLQKGCWVDRDYIILHASFQCLKDCVEKEKLFDHSHHYAKSRNGKIAKELYDWWEIRRNDPDWDGFVEGTKISKYDVDTKQLIRLVKIRSGLWT